MNTTSMKKPWSKSTLLSLLLCYSTLCLVSSFHLQRLDVHVHEHVHPIQHQHNYYHRQQHPRQQQHHHHRQKHSNLYAKEENKNGPEYEYYRPQARGPPPGGDMAYNEANLRRAAETFQLIRQIGGVECTNDVYARGFNRFEYWYIGKIARTDGTVTLNQSISRLWNLLEEHACRLRPVELGREYGRLEIWCANGDSELKMSQATPSSRSMPDNNNNNDDDDMSLIKMERFVDGSQNVNAKEVGFMAEFVTNNGQGFYIFRDDQGKLMQ